MTVDSHWGNFKITAVVRSLHGSRQRQAPRARANRNIELPGGRYPLLRTRVPLAQIRPPNAECYRPAFHTCQVDLKGTH